MREELAYRLAQVRTLQNSIAMFGTSGPACAQGAGVTDWPRCAQYNIGSSVKSARRQHRPCGQTASYLEAMGCCRTATGLLQAWCCNTYR